MGEPPIWVVLGRSLGYMIASGDDDAFAAMVLDQGTGLVRGLAVAPNQSTALRQAMTSALTQPASELPPGRPELVLCCGLDPASVRKQLATLLPKQAMPPTRPQAVDAAEDIFDSMVGNLSGRAQPTEFPTPDAWRCLMAVTAEYARAQPWARWPDDEMAQVNVTVDGRAASFMASVIGASGVQRGLNLFPEGRLPHFDGRYGPPVMPSGTLIVWLDERDDGDGVPPEFVGKAMRYGWPEDLPYLPTYLAFGSEGPADIGREDARRLAVAVGAVVDQSRRPTAPPVGRARRGRVPVDADTIGTYTLRLVR
jgi:hypothetical protein